MENIKFKTDTKLVQFAKAPASIWKFRCSDGQLIQVFDTKVDTFCVACFANGNVIVGGDNYTPAGYIDKHSWMLTSTLRLLYSCGLHNRNYGVCVDNKGHWYMASLVSAAGRGTVWKVTESGYVVWEHLEDVGANFGQFFDVAVNSEDDVIAVDGRIRDETIIKINGRTSVRIWKYDTEVQMQGVVVDSNDDICAVGGRVVATTRNVWKLDTDGNFIWKYDTTASGYVYDVAVDVNDDFYITGHRVGAGVMAGWKLRGSDGVLLETYEFGLPQYSLNDHGYGITVEKPGIATIEEEPTAEGSGYEKNDILAVTEGNGGQVRVLSVDDDGGVLTLELYKKGAGYTTGSGKATTGDNGTGCTIEILTVTDMSVYIVGDQNNSHKNIWKFANDGTSLWSANTGYIGVSSTFARGVALDVNGEYIFVAGQRVVPA